MKNYIERMKDERYGLAVKVNKLTDYLFDSSKILDDTEKLLMRKQCEAMTDYLDILEARIAHATLKEKM